MSLWAAIWDDYASPSFVGHVGEVGNCDVRWSLPGGVQDFTVVALRRGAAAYLAYKGWLGQRIIVHDHFCDKPVLDGTVVDARLQGQLVVVRAMGPWWRLFDDYEGDDPGAVNNDAYMKTVLTNHCAVVNSDQDNMDSITGVSVNGYALPAQGLHPGRILEEMLLCGDGDDNPLYFWLQSANFDNDGAPQLPLPYLAAASTGASIDWQVWQRDKVARSNVLARDISDLATSVTALYDNAGVTAETAAATNNTATYWTRKRAVSSRGSTATMAAEVRDTELARLSEPQLRREFSIGAREVMDGDGARWPLWRLLIGGGYLRDNSIGPDEGLFDLSLDYKRVGRITDMRYRHRQRRLDVSLDRGVRVDSLLANFCYEWRMTEQIQRQLQPGL